ncbi:GLPGLI family protein [Bergeyella zoohelcum]|uniref:GLPGLI family protein n=1 Tax=Bergeyella zoohelcum TaxID=1015 RepID=A0A7Z8YQ24_9FLAO|nr:GLPGLI family protein [Bergeyella zoohelcum]VDH05953.1 GLPGLI family protein [Bergeyella zoohelcum]
MKKIFLLLLLIPFCILAQTKRFHYNLAFVPNEKQEDKIYHEKMILDIEEKRNLFYSQEYARVDSINETNRNDKIFAYPKFSKVVKWEKKEGNFEFFNKLSIMYYVYPVENTLQWELLSEKKVIGEFTVQKAICMYGGRKWIAWFTTELPLPYGPYVFYGLPGLVLEVYDENKHYVFSLFKSEIIKKEDRDTLDMFISKGYFGVKRMNIKQKDWKKILYNYYQDPIPEYKSGEEAMMTKNDGTPYTAEDYRNLEKNIRTSMKNNNNPIELDQKVSYE